MRSLTWPIALLLAAASGACGGSDLNRNAGIPKPSLIVRTEPSGARVRVNRLIQSWLTPCEIVDPAVPRGMLDVEITLEGYEPMRTFVYYDGETPAKIDRRLVSSRPVVVAPEPAPPPKPAAETPPNGTLFRLDPVRGGSRLTLVSPGARVRISARSIVFDADRGGVYFLPNVPPETVVVEFLDPVTGGVLQTLSIPSPGGSP